MENNSKNLKALKEIEYLIDNIGIKKEDELVRAFLNLSEEKDVDPELQSFAIDAMLVAEDDFYGEFKSVEELRNRFLELKRGLAFAICA